MTKHYELKNIIDVSNKKAIEWQMAQKRIEEIFAKFSHYSECTPEHIKNELENELRRMWSDLETYKIELEMQNDELLRAFQDAEDVRKDYVELFNSSPVGYLILNSSAIIINANQTFADMVKTDLTHIYQKPFQNFIAHKDVSDFLSRFKSYFRNPSEKFFELTINDSSYKSITVRLEGIRKNISGFAKRSPAGERNRADGYQRTSSHEWGAAADGQNENAQEVLLISLSDITQLKKAEEEKDILKERLLQARKMEAIGTLSAGIAHDFNNILFPILGFSEMIRDDLLSKQKEMENIEHGHDRDGLIDRQDMISMAQSIVNSTLKAKALVKQILAFSRTSSNIPNQIYLNMILTEVIVSTRLNLPSNIRLVDNIDNTCSMVLVDPEQTRQVIVNLINNAIEAVEDSGGTITVTLKEDIFNEHCFATGASVNGRYVCMSIMDTGRGIEKENLSRIFDPYFSTKPKFKGGGLGLSLVHGAVSANDGVITVKSKPGEGSEFRIFFPCQDVPPGEKQTPLKLKLAGGNEKVLLLDDQESITKVLRVMLEKLGYKVMTYNEPIKALNSLKEAPEEVELLITDMTMPEMTGDDVAREAMRIKPGIPVLILTGYSEKLSPKQAAEMGIKGYLMKPVSLADLAESVRSALNS